MSPVHSSKANEIVQFMNLIQMSYLIGCSLIMSQGECGPERNERRAQPGKDEAAFLHKHSGAN